MISRKSKDKLDKIVLPSWNDLVIVRNNRVIKVDWEGDFILKDALDNVKDYRESRKAFNERSNLYKFLHEKRVILNLSSPVLSPAVRKLVIIPAEYNKKDLMDNPVFRDYYNTGPRHDGIIYDFNKLYRRIAEDWVEAYNRHNPTKEAFLPD